MPIIHSKELVKRYTKALFLSAQESNSLDAINKDLENIGKLMASLPTIGSFINSAVTRETELVKFINILQNQLSLTKLTANFCFTLVKNRRLKLLSRIIEEFQSCVIKLQAVEEVKLFSASVLEDKQIAIIKESLIKTLGKQVIIENQVDESMLGGFIVQIGSVMLDDSLRGKLEKVKTLSNEVLSRIN